MNMQYFVITFRRTAMSQNTVLLHNRYRVRSILGTGGFSTIYLAVDETTGTEVSVKEFTAEHMDGLATALRVNAYDIANRSEPQPVPDPSDLSGEEKLSRGLMQVRREAQMLDLFSGVPGVPGVLDTFQENNTFYLVKEYLEGMTCKEYMDRFRGRMPFTLALYIMKGTLEILQAIHSRGYIHCDISPINSFLCRDGGVYLIDWGNAVDLSGSMEDHVVRQAVNIRYAAPEQQISGRTLTPATDLYCLCATIYDAVCGEPPRQCVERLRGEPLVPPVIHVSDLPAFVNDLLLSGLELDPAKRPQSSAELLEIINREVAFSVSPVSGTGNASVSARLLNEKRSPFGFLTSRRSRRPTLL